jgi:uncharacterized 2Fe-2S/4Fe-4S cluster protein (DUF4445 family)
LSVYRNARYRDAVYSITVMPENKTLFYEPGQSLLTILQEGGISVESPCGGGGTCGKCKVTLLLGEKRVESVRLACSFFPLGNLTVMAPEKELSVPSRSPIFSISSISSISAREGASLGLAVDVGATTLEAALVDRETGEELAARSALNPQTRYGLDVLSRISRAMKHPEEVRVMQRALVETVNAMAEDLCRQVRVRSSSVDAVAAAGNCTMLHLLLGISPAPLGAFPFTPVFLRSQELPAHEVGLTALEKNARLVCLPSASAFIGADIVAGIYATGLTREKGNVLFLDIGTNGEMVLSRRGTLVSCSCAAGPALEGMNIGCGMRAEPGAIEDVSIHSQGVVRLRVIGDVAPIESPPIGRPPIGICGSGILAAIRELLRVGLLRRDGSLLTKGEVKEELPPERWGLAALCREEDGVPAIALLEDMGNIVVTQSDVRQVQLAKGALLSGSLALLSRAGLEIEEIDKVLVAGQFGAHLPLESLVECGIIPYEPSLTAGKVEYVGNASTKGALAVLTSPTALAEMDALARDIAYVELGATPGYEELFIRCLEFPRKPK